MTGWTDADLYAAFGSLEGPVDPRPEFAGRLFDDLMRAVDEPATADASAVPPGPALWDDDEREPVIVPLEPVVARRRLASRRQRLLGAAAVVALVAAAAIGVVRWRSNGTDSLTAAIPANLVRLDEHCRSALAPVSSAIADFDAAAASGRGPLSADDLRVLATAIDQFSAAAVAVTAEPGLPSRIRRPLEQAQATAADALRALDDSGSESMLRARDAQYAARETLTGALRIAADDGAVACRPPW
jgi:hypothetical protein